MMTSKLTMNLFNLIGRRRRYDVNDAVPLLVEKCVRMFYCFNFSSTYIKFFVKILTERNVHISNEFIFSDIYRSVNYIGSLAPFT